MVCFTFFISAGGGTQNVTYGKQVFVLLLSCTPNLINTLKIVHTLPS